MSKRAIKRFDEALKRLLSGTPEKVKTEGGITLNRINNEAGYKRSYIHKFKPFISKVVKPAQKQYNLGLEMLQDLEARSDKVVNTLSDEDAPTLSIAVTSKDSWKDKCKNEERLKQKYYNKMNDYKDQIKRLETINNTLMYRVYELQESTAAEVASMKGVN
ncbi:hypothetical protein H4F17_11545 [Vibrio cholerae]